MLTSNYSPTGNGKQHVFAGQHPVVLVPHPPGFPNGILTEA